MLVISLGNSSYNLSQSPLYTAAQSEKGAFFSAIKNFHFEKNKKNVFQCVFNALFTLYCVK